METIAEIIEKLNLQKQNLEAEYGVNAYCSRSYNRCLRHIKFLEDKEALNEKLKDAHIKKELWNFEGEIPHYTEIENAISEGRNVFLWGTPGCGKTFSASAFLKVCVCKQESAQLVHGYHLEQSAKESLSFSNNRKDPLGDIINKQHLVIDDMGLEKPTEYIIKLLFQVLNDREESDLPTIMISNFDQQNLMKRFSSYTENTEYVGALVSRMFGNCEIINFTGADRRFSK